MMAKDTIKVNMNVYDIPILVEQLKKLEQENKQLKEDKKKAIEWVHKHISKYNCKGITIIDWDELSNPNELLEILGDKE